ncbi:hypothetical protein DFH08DRAFT_976085 [Mycena albidolilacea]|uniref:Uncharacterized protein n=1 Tax=Mycena albidolilacea TaxID=1033008 RepID=A0AAD6Z4D9_9AGAR|nr:hypothetical protein DFH08DRAFT_976085 [Mycena albidolilacea]
MKVVVYNVEHPWDTGFPFWAVTSSQLELEVPRTQLAAALHEAAWAGKGLIGQRKYINMTGNPWKQAFVIRTMRQQQLQPVQKELHVRQLLSLVAGLNENLDTSPRKFN